MQTLNDSTQTAQKAYVCDACRAWDRSGYGKNDVSAAEWLTVQAAKADHWLILAGQQYRKIVYVDCGDLMTYRARLDMDALCAKHDLFDEC